VCERERAEEKECVNLFVCVDGQHAQAFKNSKIDKTCILVWVCMRENERELGVEKRRGGGRRVVWACGCG